MKRFSVIVLALMFVGAAFAQTTVTLWHMEQPPHRVATAVLKLDKIDGLDFDSSVKFVLHRSG